MNGKTGSKRLSLCVGLLAAASAGAVFFGASEAQAAAISIHVILDNGPPQKGLWITIPIGSQSWSSLSPDLSAGHLDYTVPGLDPVMGMNYTMTDGTSLMGGDVTSVMGGMDVSGVGSPQMEMAGISLWIIWGLGGRSGGIHLITPFGSPLAFEGMTPEGQLAYGAHGLSIPISFHETEDGVGDIGIQNLMITDLEWVSNAALPTPGALSLAGVGVLGMASRRRR